MNANAHLPSRGNSRPEHLLSPDKRALLGKIVLNTLFLGVAVIGCGRLLISVIADNRSETFGATPLTWCLPGHEYHVSPNNIEFLQRRQLIQPVVQSFQQGRPTVANGIFNQYVMELVSAVDETTVPRSSDPRTEALIQGVQQKVTCLALYTEQIAVAPVKPGAASVYETTLPAQLELTTCGRGEQKKFDMFMSAGSPPPAVDAGITTVCEY